jgi:YgiT-type zinc finger domain-containing protein
MKCVVCKSPVIEKKMVDEEIKAGEDIVLVQMEVFVCLNCGERYYDRKTIREIERIRDKVKSKEITLEPAGRILRAKG